MIVEILQEINASGIDYVSWKNNHLLESSLAGKRDVDLYVPANHRWQFNVILKQNFWIELDNKFIRYPWITHYYKLHSDGTVFHLHVYYKVVTGESRLKEYEFPWGKFFIDNREMNENRVWILNKEAQSYIYVVRHLLKGASYQSRKVYKRELASYDDEFALVDRNLSFENLNQPFDITKYIPKSGLLNNTIRLPSIFTALKFKCNLYLYRRKFIPLIWQRFLYLFYRVIKYLTACLRSLAFRSV